MMAGNTSGSVTRWSSIAAPGTRRTTSQAHSAVNGTTIVAVAAPRISVLTIESRNEPGPEQDVIVVQRHPAERFDADAVVERQERREDQHRGRDHRHEQKQHHQQRGA